MARIRFAAAADPLQLGLECLDRSASRAKNAAIIARLVPVARGLAAGGLPIIVGDLREEAVRLGILTGREKGRDLSFLGAVMKRAGLKELGYRRSQIEQSHGNLNREWGL